MSELNFGNTPWFVCDHTGSKQWTQGLNPGIKSQFSLHYIASADSELQPSAYSRKAYITNYSRDSQPIQLLDKE